MGNRSGTEAVTGDAAIARAIYQLQRERAALLDRLVYIDDRIERLEEVRKL